MLRTHHLLGTHNLCVHIIFFRSYLWNYTEYIFAISIRWMKLYKIRNYSFLTKIHQKVPSNNHESTNQEDNLFAAYNIIDSVLSAT